MAAKFENFSISPEFPINFRKNHQISKNYIESPESYGQKPLEGSLKTPPGLNRVKGFDTSSHRYLPHLVQLKVSKRNGNTQNLSSIDNPVLELQ